jgi:hypothetical protein
MTLLFIAKNPATFCNTRLIEQYFCLVAQIREYMTSVLKSVRYLITGM